jgi:hypothetical protein
MYNVTVFGSIMPISGQAESLIQSFDDNIYWMGGATIDYLSIFYYHSAPSLSCMRTGIVFALLLSAWTFTLTRNSVQNWITTRYDLRALLPIVLFQAILLFYYVLFFSAPHMLDRYFTLLRLVAIILFAMVLPMLYSVLRARRWLRIVLMPAGLAFAGFTVLHYYGTFAHVPWWAELYNTGRWAATQTDTIGMLQSGTTGFIAPNVVNLDGKVNAAALTARREHRLAAYVAESRFHYLVDWQPQISKIVDGCKPYGVRYDSIGSIYHMVIYERVQ